MPLIKLRQPESVGSPNPEPAYVNPAFVVMVQQIDKDHVIVKLSGGGTVSTIDPVEHIVAQVDAHLINSTR